MATLEELVINLVAESSQLRAELDKSSKSTAKATDKMDDAIEKFSKDSSKNMSFFQQSMATATGFLGSQVVLGAFRKMQDAAASLFRSLVVDGVAAAQAQEDAINKLNTALALSGQFTRAASKEIQAYASELQTMTKFGDEAILETAALIQSLGGLEKEGLKKATAATLDMASALGIDLKAAAVLVGKAAAGEISSFTRYGVVIKKGANNADTFAKALDAINKKFGGSAAAQVATYSGRVQQLSNSWGDLTEEIGFTLTQNQAVLKVIETMNRQVNDVTGSINDGNQAYKELVGEGMVGFLETSAGVITALDATIRAFRTLFGVLQALATPIEIVLFPLIAVFEGLDGAAKTLTDDIQSMADNITALSDDSDGALADMAVRMLELRDAAKAGLEEVKSGAEAMVEPTNKAKDSVKELAEEEQKRLSALEESAVKLAEISTNDQTRRALDLELEKAHLDDKLITLEEFLQKKQEILDNNQQDERDKLLEAKEQGLIDEKQFNDASEALRKKHVIQQKKIANDLAKFEEQQNKAKLKGASQFFSGMAALAELGGKKTAHIAKGLATAEATINAYLAASNAFATVPYPFNFAASAGALAQGLATVAKINGIGLNDGGTLQGGGANVDRIPADLSPGETVVSRDLTNKLERVVDAALNGGGGLGGKIVVEIRMNDNASEVIEAGIVERQAIGVSKLGVS